MPHRPALAAEAQQRRDELALHIVVKGTPEDVLKACLEGLSLLESELAEDHEWIKQQIQLARDEFDRREGIPGEESRARVLAEVRRITGPTLR